MNSKTLIQLALGAAISGAAGTALAEQMPSTAEMWRIIQQQQKEIAALKSQLKNTDDKAEAAVEAIETSVASSSGHGSSGKTTIGGYGELHYNNLEGSGGASDKDEIDLHRVIMFLGHEFSDKTRFFSEIEYEHANTEINGVVEIEQAYIERDLSEQAKVRAGMFLVPAGIINETHEPPTFYGVERNPVEKNIIPATWSVGGVDLVGQFGQGFSYDLAIHEGMNTSAADSYKVRSGRQWSSQAVANDLAFTGRLKWTGMPGVELAGTYQYQSDMTQGLDSTAGSASLYEVHGIFNKGPFTLKALYALWDLDGSGPAAIGADEQSGWYIEPSYKISETVGLFTRFNQYDNAAGSSSASEKQQWDVGVNWWIEPDVVIKADYQSQDNDNDQNRDGFNLGVGFQF